MFGCVVVFVIVSISFISRIEKPMALVVIVRCAQYIQSFTHLQNKYLNQIRHMSNVAHASHKVARSSWRFEYVWTENNREVVCKHLVLILEVSDSE